MLKAATAFASNDSIESSSYEDAAIGAKQSHLTSDGESVIVCLVNVVLSDCPYMFLELLGNVDFHGIFRELNLYVKAHFRTN